MPGVGCGRSGRGALNKSLNKNKPALPNEANSCDNRKANLLILRVPVACNFLDTEEVRGSSPPGPTILFNRLAQLVKLRRTFLPVSPPKQLERMFQTVAVVLFPVGARLTLGDVCFECSSFARAEKHERRNIPRVTSLLQPPQFQS